MGTPSLLLCERVASRRQAARIRVPSIPPSVQWMATRTSVRSRRMTTPSNPPPSSWYAPPMRAPLVAAVLGVALFACNDPSSHGREPAAASSSSSTTSPAASAAAAPSGSAASAPAVWTGSYASKPGSMYVYDGGEWKGVHFRGDDASVGLGDGTLALTLDPKTHLVHGTGAGSLGDLIITGAFDPASGEVSFSLLRKDTTDRGFTGTGVAHLSGSALSGSMRLSRGDAHVIRDADFALAPAP